MPNSYLIGTKHQQGSFLNKDSGEVINYNNEILFILSDDDVSSGYRSFEVKIKFEDLTKITGYDEDRLIALVNRVVKSGNLRGIPVDLIYTVDRSGKAKLANLRVQETANK